MDHFKVALTIADVLDNKFRFLGFRFGLDPIIGLIPWFGDVVSLLLSLYIIWIGVQMQLPREKLQQMWGNTILDFMLGLFPFFGDIADFVYKSNQRNLKILRDHREHVVEGRLV